MNFDCLEEYPWTYTPPPRLDPKYEFLGSHKTFDAFEVGGLKFVCPPGIYHPTEFSATRFMYRGLFNELPRVGRRVLDMGTGCGALGICLAATGREATLVDINPAAVACAANNAALNRVQVRTLCSDLFEAVPGEEFDLVVFNIPLLDKPVASALEVIACDPEGRLFTRFMGEAPACLAPGGAVCVSVSNLGNRAAILAALSRYKYRILFSEYYGGDAMWKCLLWAQPR